MKILKLEFENINSYEGKVTIDFTDPEFQKGNNQFVICGPMGAGKSTILDAITLALYGCTARLGKLTKDSGMSPELINKRSGYCRSKVIYSCRKGIFESTYELHKAYDKTDGKVQKPECGLRNITDEQNPVNELDSTAIEKLSAKNSKIIGLTYDQFVRCILIPQGEFDRFLNSDDREKAGILARLSNTEHYKKAAALLNEKASRKNIEFNNLKTRRDEIQVMSEEERKAVEEDKEKLSKLASEQDRELKELGEMISWLTQLQTAVKNCEAAKAALDGILAQQDTYNKNQEELTKAKRAADCDQVYQGLSARIKETEIVREKRKSAEDELREKLSGKTEAEAEAKRCADEYNDKKEDREKQKELWSRVRDLEIKISAAKSDKGNKEKACKKAGDELKEKTAEYKKYAENIEEYDKNIKGSAAWLEEHSADAELGEKLPVFAEKINARKKESDKLKAALDKRKKYAENRIGLQKEKEELAGERDSLSEELHALVSSKYLMVAEILRQDLKPGCSCPVCGKEYKAEAADAQTACAHDQAAGPEEASDKNDTAVRITELKNAIDKAEDGIKKKDEDLLKVTNEIENAEHAAEDAGNEIKRINAEINDSFGLWGVHADEDTSEAELRDAENELGKRNDTYKKRKEENERLEKERNDTKIKMDGITLTDLQGKYEQAEKEFSGAQQSYDELLAQKTGLFGDRNVDEVEKEFDKELAEKENNKNAAEKKLREVVDFINRKETEIKGYTDRETELKVSGDELRTEFENKLTENSFSSEEDFKACRKEKDVMERLEKELKEYEGASTTAQTTYDNAFKEQERLKAENKTDGTLEGLNERQESLKESKSKADRDIGAIQEKLKQDDDNRKLWAEKDEELKKLGAEAQIYSEIGNMLGKKDGSDFEVFVQGIAMHSLLEKANVYLGGIIPSYRLVQNTENSIDFRVYETREDMSVVIRDLKNFSGGEKFIISLSLALAMAEFAGQNGDVECIFLDEGFGTLSGEPLHDAISALKKLSTTGKMLGIITHIEAVIQSFNKIEAEKVGERSILNGPGVSCTKAESKKQKRA